MQGFNDTRREEVMQSLEVQVRHGMFLMNVVLVDVVVVVLDISKIEQ